MKIAVINESTLVKNSDANLMTQAVQKQLTSHVLPAWNGKTATIKFYSDKNTVPNDAWVVSILDNSDVAGALGYHDINSNQVDGFIFASPVLENGGKVLYDPANPQNFTISSVLSHEVCEMVGDPYANTFCDNNRTSWALELCDPVESDSYTIALGTFKKTIVSVSNFVFPAFFDPQADSHEQLDYMDKVKAPFSLSSGGYAIVRTGGPGTEKQIFGEKPSWKKSKGEFSRSVKRMK